MEGSLNKRQNCKLQMIYKMGILGLFRETEFRSYLPHRGPNRPCPRIYAFDPGEGQVKSITMGHS